MCPVIYQQMQLVSAGMSHLGLDLRFFPTLCCNYLEKGGKEGGGGIQCYLTSDECKILLSVHFFMLVIFPTFGSGRPRTVNVTLTEMLQPLLDIPKLCVLTITIIKSK